MKAKFALMLVLASSLSFVACSDDDDDDNVAQIVTSATSYAGTTVASVMNVDLDMPNDVLILAPMENNAKYAQITFAAREMTVMGSMSITMDAFTIDSLVCSGSADNLTLTREKPFAVADVNVAIYNVSTPQTVTGVFDESTLKDGVLNVNLSEVKAHASMPMTLTMTFEGQKK